MLHRVTITSKLLVLNQYRQEIAAHIGRLLVLNPHCQEIACCLRLLSLYLIHSFIQSVVTQFVISLPLEIATVGILTTTDSCNIIKYTNRSAHFPGST